MNYYKESCFFVTNFVCKIKDGADIIVVSAFNFACTDLIQVAYYLLIRPTQVCGSASSATTGLQLHLTASDILTCFLKAFLHVSVQK